MSNGCYMYMLKEFNFIGSNAGVEKKMCVVTISVREVEL